MRTKRVSFVRNCPYTDYDRAARNVEGRVILYADVMTGSLERAIKETNRRRGIQVSYNKKHNITPKKLL